MFVFHGGALVGGCALTGCLAIRAIAAPGKVRLMGRMIAWLEGTAAVAVFGAGERAAGCFCGPHVLLLDWWFPPALAAPGRSCCAVSAGAGGRAYFLLAAESLMLPALAAKDLYGSI